MRLDERGVSAHVLRDEPLQESPSHGSLPMAWPRGAACCPSNPGRLDGEWVVGHRIDGGCAACRHELKPLGLSDFILRDIKRR